MSLNDVYRMKLAFLTDLYQLTMASGYFTNGMASKQAVFNLFFRQTPFGGGYALCAGLQQAAAFIEQWCFDDQGIAWLSEQTGIDGRPLFQNPFLDYLGTLRFSGSLEAIPEGTVVFPNEPLLRVCGPLIECQLLETALLCLINFNTLIATKAARVVAAASGDPVLEFGLRRAQGIDGALSASRAAFLGGCAGTSNVLAGRLYGIPVKGTHAHSWVMSFDDELSAFQAYARAMPNNCTFLVDTYETVAGVHNAVRAGRELRSQGHEMLGIRLDSGDLDCLSRKARAILDAEGFPKAKIVASNDLDEHAIAALKAKGAPIDIWGVGTKLVTAYDQPALGGVYKLAAIRDPGSAWHHRIKLSEEAVKTRNPGLQQVRRFSRDGRFGADLIYEQSSGPDAASMCNAAGEIVTLPAYDSARDLLEPVFVEGRRVTGDPPLTEIRERADREKAALPVGVSALKEPVPYPVGLAPGLQALKRQLARELG